MISMAKKIIAAVKKAVKKTVVKKKVEVVEKVVKVVPVSCVECNGGGLKDAHTLCSQCSGTGIV